MKRLLTVFIVCSSMFFSHFIVAQERLYTNTFPIGDVRLLPGLFQHARDLNIKVLLEYDVNRLLTPYLKEAGLSVKGPAYKNWEGLDGHVGGHYLTAMAMNYAATGNAECKRRMEYMIAELKACQVANTLKYPGWGIGYVGGVPQSDKIWSSVKKGDFTAFRAAWVPWYNIHKMYAGLRDAWMYAGNTEAKDIFLKFCDWGIGIISGLTDEQMQAMLDTEHGGMNEVYADAYQISGEQKYLHAAIRFSHRMLLDAMAAKRDNLDNKHANTQVPKAIGFQRIAELTGDKTYGDAGSFFWETVTGKRSLAFGGNSRREFFPSIAASDDFVNDVEGPETCNTYNMLKLTEDLFRVNHAEKYIDFYERALFNHILSTQHPVHGGYVYFTPARPRHYRVYSAPNEAMWCCVGSGMENHSKYAQFIYTHQSDSLFLNLFIPSVLNWKQKGVVIRQNTGFPFSEETEIVITEGTSPFKLMIRYPGWVKDGALKVMVNGKPVSHSSHPSSYIGIYRHWKKGDVVRILLPMHTTIEHLPNLPEYIAFMHGPVMLSAKTGTENLNGLVANDSRWGHIASGKRLPVNEAPIFVSDDIPGMANKVVPVTNKSLQFELRDVRVVNDQKILLEPFFQLHDARYMMYWMALTGSQYRTYLDSIAGIETKKLALQKRTVDFVAPGEQQPEADHDMQKSNSNAGNQYGEFWREARDGGYFSYNLSTKGETGLSLLVRYWGSEWGGRKFDIYIDDQKLVSENNTGRWQQSKFHDIEYAVPDEMIKGKQQVRVRFQAIQGNTAGPVYYIRLLRQ